MTRKLLLATLFASASLVGFCQDKPANAPKKDTTFGFHFTPVKEIATTSVKNQSSSGTCWSFAGMAFLESEVLKKGHEAVDLSPMWVVRHTYLDKAVKYVRMHGSGSFSGGGATHDVINVIKRYGIVPEEIYTGLNYGTTAHKHGELDAVLAGYVKAVTSNSNGELTPAWIEGVNGILDAYLGKMPEKFTYKGKEYTPQSFTKSLGLNMDDYVSITSFTHQPYYTQYAIEVPDNWADGLSYNVPLNELEQVFTAAINDGYSILWASDVSEPGFQYRKGYAVMPDNKPAETKSGTEESKWVKDAAKSALIKAAAGGPVPELTITPELRQRAFDNYKTTDDHGMQIMGLAKDQDGTPYFKVKNSWGTDQLYDGYFYASYPFVLYKTMNIVVNKKAVPTVLRKKLKIE